MTDEEFTDSVVAQMEVIVALTRAIKAVGDSRLIQCGLVVNGERVQMATSGVDAAELLPLRLEAIDRLAETFADRAGWS